MVKKYFYFLILLILLAFLIWSILIMSKSKENKSVRFVAISSNNNIKYENILYSYDGKNWLLNSDKTGAAINSDGFTVVYGNNLWLAGGDGEGDYDSIINSTDGLFWNSSSENGVSPKSSVQGIGFGKDENGDILWVSAGEKGTGSNYLALLYSYDGLCWIDNNQGISFNDEGKDAAYGTSNGISPLWVAVGEGGTSAGAILWSSNGKTWNESDSNGASFPMISSYGGPARSIGEGVAYGTSDGTCQLWVAVGKGGTSSGAILWSSNGKTWNESDSNGASFLNKNGIGVAYGTSDGTCQLWVAVGDGGTSSGAILWSSNGKTWNESDSNGASFLGKVVNYVKM